MSISLKIRQALIVDGVVVAGDKNLSQTITLTAGQAYIVRARVIADDYGEDILWTTALGGLDTFTHGFILSDQDLVVELKTDNGTPEYVLVFIQKNVLTALPAKAGGNTTESVDGAILVDGTDFDNVQQIRVQRDVADAAGNATVDLFLFA